MSTFGIRAHIFTMSGENRMRRPADHWLAPEQATKNVPTAPQWLQWGAR
jgi:hypothetical protein